MALNYGTNTMVVSAALEKIGIHPLGEQSNLITGSTEGTKLST